MNKRHIFILGISSLLLSSVNCLAQKKVSLIDLGVKKKQYFKRLDTIPFTGTAYADYLSDETDSELIIENGYCIRHKRLTKSGFLISLISYAPGPDGEMDGEYLERTPKGDTLSYGKYSNGKKEGQWIETQDEVKYVATYKDDVQLSSKKVVRRKEH